MNEIATSATKAKTAKHVEVPAELRELIDQGVVQARDTYAKARAAGEEAADLLKTPMRPQPRVPQATI